MNIVAFHRGTLELIALRAPFFWSLGCLQAQNFRVRLRCLRKRELDIEKQNKDFELDWIYARYEAVSYTHLTLPTTPYV